MKFGYARVSTESQELNLQIDALKKAGCDEIITEVMTGTISDRPERAKLFTKLRAGDTLVVWRLDRFGRSMRDLIDKVEMLRALDVDFESLEERIDTTSASGRLVFHLFAAMAEFERNLISERTKAGLAASRARGRQGGRKKKLSDKQIKAARNMLAEKMNVTEVAAAFGVARSTLYRCLAND